jgi:hypothetical protein
LLEGYAIFYFVKDFDTILQLLVERLDLKNSNCSVVDSLASEVGLTLEILRCSQYAARHFYSATGVARAQQVILDDQRTACAST